MSSRGDLPFRIKDLLGDVGSRLGLKSALETGQVWSRWTEIVGEAVAEHAEPSSLKGGVLRVRTDSPGWANEIGYLRDEIKVAVNSTVGSELVNEVRVWTGPGARTKAAESPAPPPAPAQTSGLVSDPQVALERAREAWARRHSRRA